MPSTRVMGCLPANAQWSVLPFSAFPVPRCSRIDSGRCASGFRGNTKGTLTRNTLARPRNFNPSVVEGYLLIEDNRRGNGAKKNRGR